MRKFLALPLLCCVTLAGHPQERPPEPSTYTGNPSDGLVRQWLTASDPRLAAWAAHFILEDHRTALLPDEEAIIERWELERTAIPVSATSDRRFAMAVLLDTEIQLDGKLRPETIVNLEQAFNTQRLLLLAELPWADSGAAWAKLYQPGSNKNPEATRVAAQMLVQHPPAGFAAKLLGSVSVRANITVVAGDDELGVGVGSGSCCGAGIKKIVSNWPKTGSYFLFDIDPDTGLQSSDESVWLSGPDPIGLRRAVADVDSYVGGCGGLRPLDDSIRSHLVGTLLGGDPAAPFPERPVSLTVHFISREAYREAVEALVSEQSNQFNRIAARLTAAGLLTEEERQSLALPIELSLSDLRKQPAVDLPPVPVRAPVRWMPPSPSPLDSLSRILQSQAPSPEQP